jgi:prepilin-type N-terminal cleavage/methylation domain-containing protein
MAKALSRTRARAHRGVESGFTLVETLIAVSLLAISVIGIMYSLTTFISVSGVARSSANLDAVVRTYTEGVVAAPYVNCASSYSSVTLPSGYSFSSGPTLSYWNGDDPATFSSTCSTDKGAQRIAATVREQSSGRIATVTITKNAG